MFYFGIIEALPNVTFIFTVIAPLCAYTKSHNYPFLFSVDSHFNQGSEVNLTCSNETRKEMLFIRWKIELKNKKTCQIGSIDGRSDDDCKDGKSLRNTSSGLSYLHIPNISETDEGKYDCDSTYTGGNDHHVIHVTVTGRTVPLWRFILSAVQPMR